MLKPVVTRTANIDLNFQPYIMQAPTTKQEMWGQATRNDNITIESWRETWISNAKKNKEHFGLFADYSVGELFGSLQHKSCILAGSGPSLAYNGELLKDRQDMPLISCLHNFHYFEDRDIEVDYYVSLDAGPVVLEEISEGGQHDEEWYWERTADKTLIAYISSDPELFKKWRGKIYLFNVPVPDKSVEEELDALEPFHIYLSTGGNVLGACMYVAKVILGCTMTAFVGADFSFSYKNKFHGWDSKYDKEIGRCILMRDVYGLPVNTWQSYANFAVWFNYIAQQVPGIYINCTEGGIFGSYSDGNIIHVKQMRLAEFLNMSNMNFILEDQFKNCTINQRKILF